MYKVRITRWARDQIIQEILPVEFTLSDAYACADKSFSLVSAYKAEVLNAEGNIHRAFYRQGLSEEYFNLAVELYNLQQSKNNQRGVSCIRAVVVYLLMGNFERAQAVANWDQDKIRSYPDLDKFCIEHNLHDARMLNENGEVVNKPFTFEC